MRKITAKEYTAPRTVEQLPKGQEEWFDMFWASVCMGSHYWLGDAEDENGVLYLNVVGDGDADEAMDLSLTKNDILQAIADYSGWFAEHPRYYFRRFIREAFFGNWAGVDYDADVTDVVLQLAVFGGLKYA